MIKTKCNNVTNIRITESSEGPREKEHKWFISVLAGGEPLNLTLDSVSASPITTTPYSLGWRIDTIRLDYR